MQLRSNVNRSQTMYETCAAEGAGQSLAQS